MDKIYECGRKFADLLNCKYHLVVSGNRKIMKLTLDFKETDLRHISGLHYIDPKFRKNYNEANDFRLNLP